MTRVPMLGFILKCPECGTQRMEKAGLNSKVKDVWYLGCECPAPSGLMVKMPRKGRIMDEVVDLLRQLAIVRRATRA